MAQHETDTGYDHLHLEVWERLPWYVNQTLEGHELAQVEQHLARCTACQEEVIRWHRIATAVRHTEASAPSPSPERFASLMAQIDATEAVGYQRRNGWETLCHTLHRYASLFHGTPRVAQAVLAVEGALILLLAGLLVWHALPTSDVLYTTLSSGEERSTQPRGQIRLVFAEQMTAKELRDLLTSMQAMIINGPSPRGVYTVEVPLVVGKPDPIQSLLEVFRAHPHVRLAEPVSRP